MILQEYCMSNLGAMCWPLLKSWKRSTRTMILRPWGRARRRQFETGAGPLCAVILLLRWCHRATQLEVFYIVWGTWDLGLKVFIGNDFHLQFFNGNDFYLQYLAVFFGNDFHWIFTCKFSSSAAAQVVQVPLHLVQMRWELFPKLLRLQAHFVEFEH